VDHICLKIHHPTPTDGCKTAQYLYRISKGLGSFLVEQAAAAATATGVGAQIGNIAE
jgi:hypothetical protein